ncbi:YncE family protein [Clostridium sardiniense]|uniref:YncE family protein n=1 Tax=Clostridium sardiniense TaxID=29369 RepID=UPI001956D53F|nr:YncE family protein [Clostridium sardiniense]MBM7834135.1 YVTN family beta-propeller protein [Clostridium sardiniense]
MNNIYICNTCDDCIRRIDEASLSIENISLSSNGRPIGPRSIEVRGGLGVVANSYDNSLSFLDLRSLKEIDREYIGPHPNDVKLYEKYACVACNETNSIIFYNIENKNIEFEVPSGNSPDSIVLDSTRRVLLSANLLENTVSLINLDNKDIDKKVKVGEYPIKIIMSKNGEYFYLCESYLGSDKEGFIGIYSMKNLVCISRIKVDSMPIDVFEDNEKLYVANFGSESVSVVNIREGKVVRNINVGGMPNRVIKRKKEIFISDYLNGKLHVISDDENKRKIIAIGNEPNAMIMVNSNHQIIK